MVVKLNIWWVSWHYCIICHFACCL